MENKKKILHYKRNHSTANTDVFENSKSSRFENDNDRLVDASEGESMSADYDLLCSVIDSIADPFAVIDISNLKIIVANKAWQKDDKLGALLEIHHEELIQVSNETVRGVVRPTSVDDAKNARMYRFEWSIVKQLKMDQKLLSVTFRGSHSEAAISLSAISSERQYKSILEHTQAIIFVIGQDGAFLLSEGKGLASLGLTPGQVVGRNAFKMYADIPDVIKGVRESLGGRLHQSVVEVGPNSFETFYSPLKDDDGNVTAMLGMSIDVTERVRAEKALVESEEKYRKMFESMASGLAYHKIILDAKDQPIDYVFLEVNDSFEKHTGLLRENIIGKRITEVFPGIKDSNFDWIGAYGKVAIEGISIRFEEFSEPLDRWFDVSAFQISKDYFVVSFIDVTERVRIQNDLKKLTEKLEDERAELAGKNIALKEVLSHLEEDKNSIKERITENVRDHVIPLIERIRGADHEQQDKQIDMLKRDLLAVASPFMQQVKDKFNNLSPRELEICKMVKNGHSSKEIAELLSVSVLTVHKHREMVRKKLGIKNSDVKLKPFLDSVGDIDSP